jgi:hypothetical protein
MGFISNGAFHLALLINRPLREAVREETEEARVGPTVE